MPVIGAFARVDPDDVAGVGARIEALSGVSTFEVADPVAIGILIEADSLNAAHEVITNQLPRVPGVLGAWPVYVGLDEEGSTADTDVLPAHACEKGERQCSLTEESS